MFSARGVAIFFEAATKAEESRELGFTLGKGELLDNTDDDFLKDNLASSENPIAVFIKGFLSVDLTL